MGRPPKPVSVHRMQGTYRKDRHAGESEASMTAGNPPPMPDLDAAAAEHWRLVVDGRSEWLAESDGPALEALCQLWSLRQKTLALLIDDPADKLVRTSFSSYHDAWQKLAAKFGITPVDRARLGEMGPREESSPFVQYLNDGLRLAAARGES